MSSPTPSPQAIRSRREYICATVQRLSQKVAQGDYTPLITSQYLERHVRDFEDLVQQTIQLEGVEDLTEILQQQESFMDDIEVVQAELDRRAHNTRTEEALPTTSPTMHSTFMSCQPIKLPKLELPKFSGNILDWWPFYDSFKNAVDINESLRPAQKLQHLKSLLTGEAAEMIRNFPVLDANYPLALKALEKRYSRRSVIGSYHLRKLGNLPVVKKLDRATASTMLSTITSNVEALRAQAFQIDLWDESVAHTILERLDERSRFKLSESIHEDRLPTLQDILNYLQNFIDQATFATVTEEDSDNSSRPKGRHINPSSPKRRSNMATTSTSSGSEATTSSSPAPGQSMKGRRNSTLSTLRCIICDTSHPTYGCSAFSSKSVADRWQIVRSKSGCANCLSPRHISDNCKSRRNCRTCGQRHHTLLHLHEVSAAAGTPGPSGTAASSDSKTTCHTASVSKTQVLLGTVVVAIEDSAGRWICTRGFVDNGSDTSYISASLHQRLGCDAAAVTIPISGFTGTETTPGTGITNVRIRPRLKSEPTYQIQAVIVPKIAERMPSRTLPRPLVDRFKDLVLADPDFHQPGPIDLLLGADIYYQLMSGRITSFDGIFAIESPLGHIISGPIPSAPICRGRTFHSIAGNQDSRSDTLSCQLQQFWELEDVPARPSSLQSADEIEAENMYRTLHSRTESGRFVVPMLRRHDGPQLGSSFMGALRCFETLRRRLKHNLTLRSAYHAFIREYITCGHMSLSSDDAADRSTGCFLPHHGVMKGPKLRVVFNGAFKTNSGVTLNDTLLPGPNLLTDLNQLLLRCRFHKYIFTPDTLFLH